MTVKQYGGHAKRHKDSTSRASTTLGRIAESESPLNKRTEVGGRLEEFSVGLLFVLKVSQGLQRSRVKNCPAPPRLNASACSDLELLFPVFRLQEVHQSVFAGVQLKIGGYRCNENCSKHNAPDHSNDTHETTQMCQWVQIAITGRRCGHHDQPQLIPK